MTEQTKLRMSRDEWLRFKAWVWLVGGTEAARVILGLGDEMFEAVWMRDVVGVRTMRKVREGLAGKVVDRAVA
jgi:hypothetical protein